MRISDWSSDVCSSDLAANRTPSQSQSEDQSQTQNPSPAPTWATERTHATTALVAATRSLMHAAATTDLPVDDLATARRAIESVTAELPARARDRDRKGVGQGKGEDVRVGPGGRRTKNK